MELARKREAGGGPQGDNEKVNCTNACHRKRQQQGGHARERSTDSPSGDGARGRRIKAGGSRGAAQRGGARERSNIQGRWRCGAEEGITALEHGLVPQMRHECGVGRPPIPRRRSLQEAAEHLTGAACDAANSDAAASGCQPNRSMKSSPLRWGWGGDPGPCDGHGSAGARPAPGRGGPCRRGGACAYSADTVNAGGGPVVGDQQ